MGEDDSKKQALEVLREIDTILTSEHIWFTLSYGSALGAIREHGFISWDKDVDILIRYPDRKKVATLLRERLSSQFYLTLETNKAITSYDVIGITGLGQEEMHVDIYTLIGGGDDVKMGYLRQLFCRYLNKILCCKYLNFNRIKKKWKIPFVCILGGIELLIPNCWMRMVVDKIALKYDIDDANYVFPFANDGKKGEYVKKEIVLKTKRVPFETLMLPVPAESDKYLRRLYGNDYMTPKRY